MALPFHELCKVGDLEGVSAALQAGTDVNSKTQNGRTGLVRALEGRHTSVVRLLLEQEDIDINVVDRGGRTALHCTMCTLYSFFSSRPSEVRLILKSPKCCTIQHKFVPARSVERNIEKIRFP